MAYALAALFDSAVQDKGRFTIFRPENTLEPVDMDLLKHMHQASGLDVPDLVRLKPERLAEQWIAALIPFEVKITDDEHFLQVAKEVREICAESIDVVTEELDPYIKKMTENVDHAIEQEFEGKSWPNLDLEVYDAVHQIHRLIGLRQDLGLCTFDEEETKRLTRELALSFFYNREAEHLVQRHVDSGIETLHLMNTPGVEVLPDERDEKHKHIHVSGGQGAGKTQLSRRTLGILRDQDNHYVRINKDIFRPLMLDPQQMGGESDLTNPADRKLYGRITEDELNMIKRKQWKIITSYADDGTLPNLLIDSTSIIRPEQVDALTERGASLTVLFVHTPINEARRRITERALGEGIPGIDSMRESLESELLEGHRESARQVASLLIHGVGKNVKLKVLDGRSADRTKPVYARVELDKGRMEVSNVRAILEIFHKSNPEKTATEPTDDDLIEQIPNFDKIASVMGEIAFLDPETQKTLAVYNNREGLVIHDEERFLDEYEGTLTSKVTERLYQFFNTHKSAMLRSIAEKRGRIFETRKPFGDGETSQVITDKYETEVPIVDQSGYIEDDGESRTLEWRHLAKRGKFLDGSFDPWRKAAPDDIRILSAHAVTNAWLSDRVINQIADNVAEQLKAAGQTGKPVTVHIAHPIKDHTRPGVNINFMVLDYTSELSKRLNLAMKDRHQDLPVTFANDRPLLALASDKSTRTTAGTLERLTSQPYYDYEVFQEGDYVLFADEHVQAGGVMLAARNIANSRNIHVLGYTALSSHNLGADLRINPSISMALETALDECARQNHSNPEDFRKDLDEALGQVGLSRDTLSNLEGLILIAYFLDGREESRRSWFESIKRTAGLDGTEVRQGMDHLDSILVEDAITPKDLGLAMQEQISRSRKAVYPSVSLEQ